MTKTLIPVTLLAFDNPLTSFYVHYLNQLGYQFSEIIHLPTFPKNTFNNIILNIVPENIRKQLIVNSSQKAGFYFPNKIYKQQSSLVINISKYTNTLSENILDLYQKTLFQTNWQNFTPNYSTIENPILKSDDFLEKFQSAKNSILLYTGKQIVPQKILLTPSKKILHAHPGHLPFVRGADGLLWSTEKRNHPSISCFIMKPQIDTGDIYHIKHFEPIKISLSSALDDLTLYRSIFSFIDPLMRAITIGELIANAMSNGSARFEQFFELGIKQDINIGNTYRFMTEHERNLTLRKIFGNH